MWVVRLTDKQLEVLRALLRSEQHLGPGEKREMAVVFYVDPSIIKDSDNDNLNTITLSYTFYPLRDAEPKPLAAKEPDPHASNL